MSGASLPDERRRARSFFGCSGETPERLRARFLCRRPIRSASSCSGAIAARPIRCAIWSRALRDSVGRDDAPVLIDQEGGRVARLRPPHWRLYPSAARLASLPDPLAEEAARLARAADRRRSGQAGHHRRLPAGARSAGAGRRSGDRRPGLWQRSGPGRAARPARCATGCSTAAYCRSSSTCPAMAAPRSTAITPARVVDDPP